VSFYTLFIYSKKTFREKKVFASLFLLKVDLLRRGIISYFLISMFYEGGGVVLRIFFALWVHVEFSFSIKVEDETLLAL